MYFVLKQKIVVLFILEEGAIRQLYFNESLFFFL